MSGETKFVKLDRKKLPLFYRILLKVPVPEFVNSINVPSGIFWAIVIPIFIMMDIFLDFYLLLAVSFPFNLILFCIFPSILLLIIARVNAARFLTWWNSNVAGGYTQREIKELLDEYLAMRKAKSKNDSNKT